MNLQRTHLASTLIAIMSITPAHALDQPIPVPTLDELLGLQNTQESPNTTAIDQALSPQQAGQAFTQAVKLMADAADRIGTANDPGLTTQRIQEEIIRKLDQVIESAQNNQSSNSSSSSSSSSSTQQQQPNQKQQSNTPSNGSGEPTDASTPPGSSTVATNNLNNAHAKWGHLPERLRDALSQGLDEPYSQLYRRLTEQYYKALAEDNQ